MSMYVLPIGVVVIGRNEGERLRQCLRSVRSQAQYVVYVDSGSTDGSLSVAQTMGVDVVELHPDTPFTAALARNRGFERLLTLNPDIEFLQFVDGDCEVVSDWLSKALDILMRDNTVGVVCGRRRERYPNLSIYNTLCDVEWDTPIGEAKACGGDALMRVEAFNAVGRYRDDLIAGEEPELCVRLRKAGWKVLRIDEEMTLHDAAMMRFSQWWRRSLRTGHAFAEGAALHGAPPERHWVRESYRAWLWGLTIPTAIICATIAFGWFGLTLLLVYPAQVGRLAINGQRTPRENWLQAFFFVLGKFPEFLGQLKFLLRKLGATKTALIEYK